MGFGTLFIGYFLILNMVKPAASDVIAGLVILLALLRLSSVNGKFALSRIFAAVFAAVGLFRFCLCFGEMILPSWSTLEAAIEPYMSMARYALLIPLTTFILLGIEEVAREVELEKVPTRARFLAVFGMGVRALFFVCSLPVAVHPILYVGAIFIEFVYVVTVLSLIWRCYMMICMPEDIDGKRKKPSRFAFVNEYRERQKEKEREMAEYRLEQMKKHAKKKGSKKKK